MKSSIVSHSALTCPSITAPSHGSISFSHTTTLGSVATYACASGYRLTSSATRKCEADGQWSGIEPSCISKLQFYWMITRNHITKTLSGINTKLTATLALNRFSVGFPTFISIFRDRKCMKIHFPNSVHEEFTVARTELLFSISICKTLSKKTAKY